MIPELASILVIAACAGFDRISGWKANGLKRILLAAVLGLIFWFALSCQPLQAVVLALGVYVWRSRPLGDLLNPTRQRFNAAVVRHLWALACVPGVVWLRGGITPANVLIPVACFVVFAFVAALLARLHHIEAKKGQDINMWIELARGAFLGLAIVIALAIG